MQTITKNNFESWLLPVENLSGIGPSIKKALQKLEINTIKDLLFNFPNRYLDTSNVCSIRDAKINEVVTVMGQVKQVNKKSVGRSKSLVEVIIFDDTGYLSAIFFNQPYMSNYFAEGETVAFAGRIEYKYNRLQINNPLYDKIPPHPNPLPQGRGFQTMGILPFHPATAGLNNKKIRALINSAISFIPKEELLPSSIIQELSFLSYTDSLKQIHFPASNQMLEDARRRLIFQEFIELQLAVLLKRQKMDQFSTVSLKCASLSKKALGFLPFKLTKEQTEALEDIKTDLALTRPMNRLLQGEVGSGKTVVSFLGCVIAVENGFQACIMAPTEILAQQHYHKIKPLAEKLNINLALLSASLKNEEKAAIQAEISSGDAQLTIGTHALIQEKAKFKNLAFAVVDEQHRFGVEQRQILSKKGYRPHIMVMTATPIPRSLALTLYGDLDVSLIKELPNGKSFAEKVTTVVCGPAKREQAYEKIRREVAKGRQAYIICPLVDPSDKIEAKAVEEEISHLRNAIFKELRVESIHGQLKSADKEDLMARFVKGQIDVLVSTTLIEVGIDVANATVMLIENADRFGLAQLHQLRGRVGRGEHESVCILFADLKTPESVKRMKAIRELKDGFALAQADLQIRGEGQIFGFRQAGLPDLKIASLTNDYEVLVQARRYAKKILNADPRLGSLPLLKKEVFEKYNKLLNAN